MENINNFHAFFNTPNVPNPVSTNLVFGRSIPEHRVSASFDKVFDGASILDATFVAGQWENPQVVVTTIREHTILHELGHQFDFIWGDLAKPGTQGNPTAFEQAIDADAIAQPGINLLANGNPRNCFPLFSTTTCQIAQNQGLTDNLSILAFRFLGGQAPFITREAFAIGFGHLLSKSPNNFGNIPELERAFDLMPNTTSFIQNHINNPPAPVQ